jgi:glutathione S-transferase
MKVETYLRMAHIPFEIKILQDPRKAPKGKLPFIVDDGKTIADSSLIIDYLCKKYGDKLDAHLSKEQKAQALALKHLAEEHLYWIIVYSRWVDPAGWAIIKPAFFAALPGFMRNFIAEMIRKDMIKASKAHGLGRHTPEEVYQFGVEDLTAISHTLGDKPFMLGDKPTSLDATIYASLMNILHTPVESPLKAHAKTFTNLKQYCKRMSEAYYPALSFASLD